jgi:orotate phosphoribosyltransferase
MYKERLRCYIEQAIVRQPLASSNTFADFYIDLKTLFLRPEALQLLAHRIAPYLHNIDAIGGSELEVALLVPAITYLYNVPGFVIRKHPHAQQQPRPQPCDSQLISPIDLTDRHVLLIDDVYTTGTSLKAAKEFLYTQGANVNTLVIVNSSENHTIPSLYTVDATGQLL